MRSARDWRVFWIGPQRKRCRRKKRTRNWTIATSTQYGWTVNPPSARMPGCI